VLERLLLMRLLLPLPLRLRELRLVLRRKLSVSLSRGVMAEILPG
jgi:hypothetical protein